MGALLDGQGGSKLVVLGSKNAAPSPGGFVWTYNSITSFTAAHLTEEGTSPPPALLTTEGGQQITTEGQAVNWQDDGFLPDIGVTTSRLGYDSDVMWNVDRASFITGSPDPCQVQMQTSAIPVTTVGVPTPGLGADATYRLVVGCSIAGRGTQVRISPTTITTQWSVDRIQIVAVPSLARPEDA